MTNNNNNARTRDDDYEKGIQHCPYCGQESVTPDHLSGEADVGVVTCPEHGGIGVVQSV